MEFQNIRNKNNISKERAGKDSYKASGIRRESVLWPAILGMKEGKTVPSKIRRETFL